MFGFMGYSIVLIGWVAGWLASFTCLIRPPNMVVSGAVVGT